MKKALVLAGGFPQIELLLQLRRRNITTVLADYYENPVAKPYADKFYRASTLDVDAIRKIAIEEQVDFLITACTDQALLTVARVSEELGLPCYIDYATALNVTNKQYMKKRFVEFGVPTSKHVVAAEISESAVSDMRYPLIVKPVDCNSSKGVRRVDSFEELSSAFAEAVRLSRTNTAIVEEFVEGDELSVDVYVENGVAHVLSVSELDKIADNERFVIFRGRYSSEKVERVRAAVTDVAQKIADAFGLYNSPMLIQLITDGERISVLEFSARTGGGIKFMLIKKATGFDVIDAVIALTLGEKPHLEARAPENKLIVNEFIYCKPGKFDRFDGMDELISEGVVSEHFLFKWQGAEFKSVESSGDRVGGFTIQADTDEEIRDKHRRAAERIRVLDTDGNDIMRHDLLTDW